MFDGPRISECSALYVCDDDWRFHCIYVARSICYSYITQARDTGWIPPDTREVIRRPNERETTMVIDVKCICT